MRQYKRYPGGWWGSEADGFAARVESEFAWEVSAEDIKERNYNLDCKNPHVGEHVNHDPVLGFTRFPGHIE